jgi:hypothetical protein
MNLNDEGQGELDRAAALFPAHQQKNFRSSALNIASPWSTGYEFRRIVYRVLNSYGVSARLGSRKRRNLDDEQLQR